MPRAFEWLYRRLGKRYFLLYVLFELGSGALITLATVGLFALYHPRSSRTSPHGSRPTGPRAPRAFRCAGSCSARFP